VSEGPIADDEVLYRRIPPGKDWFEPPDRISSLNFQLRKGELGISVYRASLISASDVLKRPEAIVGSRIGMATAGQIRAARDAKGDRLDLDVVRVNDEKDPGHAEIRGTVLHKRGRVAAKALRKLFQLIERPAEKS
jgi:hypothetical protein